MDNATIIVEALAKHELKHGDVPLRIIYAMSDALDIKEEQYKSDLVKRIEALSLRSDIKFTRESIDIIQNIISIITKDQ